MSSFTKTEAGREGTLGVQALKRVAQPDDIAQVVAVLPSDDARWIERSVLRVKNFFADLNERVRQVPFVAGGHYSAADITALVTVDFSKVLELSLPADHTAMIHWFDAASSRLSAAA